jgi:DNA repair protein RecN (Recombination protein N)
VVDKAGERGVTRSDVRTVADADRVRELSRMLAGDMVDGTAHAVELLAAADRDKTDGDKTDRDKTDRDKTDRAMARRGPAVRRNAR